MVHILLIDADSKEGFPNLALMKISAWHKQKGDTTEIRRGLEYPLLPFDKAYISCIYWQNATAANTLARMLAPTPVEVGGVGIGPDSLPNEIEHILPDYDLYEDIDFSMGYTSRGCIRKCPWCVVPKIEGDIRDHAPISEFWDPRHDCVMLFDNNFQASPHWKENLEFLLEHDLKVNFNQGLDIRLVNKEFAELLSQVKYYDWHFKNRRLHFAFDRPQYEKAVDRGIKRLEKAGIMPHRLMFYVLVGFDTTLKQDLARVRKLHDYGTLPYVMIYNKGQDRELRNLARWVNRRYYQFIPWDKYGGKHRHLKPAQSVEWGTPHDLFAELDAEFSFTVDVAASDLNHRCKKYYTLETDGLSQSWKGEKCFMNPPYGKDLPAWTKKALEESQKGAVVVGLLPVRSDTRWFHDNVLGKAEIRFLKGRVSFETGAAESMPATFPSMVVIWRLKNEDN